MELHDGELVLRPLGLGDLDAVVDACGDPEIPRFTLLVPSPYTEEDGLEFLDARRAAVARRRRRADVRDHGGR